VNTTSLERTAPARPAASPPEAGTLERVTNFVDELLVALVNAGIFWADHPRVRSSVDRLLQLLPGLTSQGPLQLASVEDCLLHEERPLLGASLSGSRLIKALRGRESGGLEFAATTTREDLRALIGLLGQRPDASESLASVNTRLQADGARWVRLLPPYRLAAGAGGTAAAGPAAPAPAVPRLRLHGRVYQEIVELLQGIAVKVCHGEAFGFDAAQTLLDRVLGLLERDPGALLQITRYERYDAFTFGHSIRVCVLAVNFARSLTTDPALLNRVGVSALLHDVGKARVPFQILHNTGRLSAEERLEMQKHPLFGAEILQDLRDSDPMAVAAAFGHHLTEDQAGYPRTFHEHRLSTVTRLCKVCDVYEALTAVRPYKRSMLPLEAYRVMLSMKDHFEPWLLRKFIQVNGIFPVGTVVELSDGRSARVRAQGAALDRPVVEVLAEGGGPLVDLGQPDAGGLSIARAAFGDPIPEGAWSAEAPPGAPA
jgi:HD-GYP domain-containing protein (c-di-GMP phosphodiesterase class II)